MMKTAYTSTEVHLAISRMSEGVLRYAAANRCTQDIMVLALGIGAVPTSWALLHDMQMRRPSKTVSWSFLPVHSSGSRGGSYYSVMVCSQCSCNARLDDKLLVLVDDYMDSGRTMMECAGWVERGTPRASMLFAPLLCRKKHLGKKLRNAPVVAGIRIENNDDRFFFGFGMDDRLGRFRGLDFIAEDEGTEGTYRRN